MNERFDGKVVLVTGANSGIGEAAAAKFAEAGATVFGIGRRKDALEEARRRHPQIKWLLADIARPSEARAMVEVVVKEGGRLDVVVNNAGVGTFGPLDALSDEQIREQFEVNVFGLSAVTAAALPALKASKGTILNISSAAGHKAMAGASHYAASKAALESLTRSWAAELAPAGVRVNAIAPGPTDTPAFGKLGVTPEGIAALKGAFVKQVPLGRLATSDEVAKWMVALSAPSVTWITGQVLSVDGGMSL
jgi:NAD(P)-dependent dehydrogenase (short-subunit alcohol dehydrogenase family)